MQEQMKLLSAELEQALADNQEVQCPRRAQGEGRPHAAVLHLP